MSAELFTVRVAGPGTSHWGVVVRAAGEDAASASVAARGHRVVGVKRGMAARPARERPLLGQCVRCGYSLARLPEGEAGEVMCPECGVINVPGAPAAERLVKIRVRRRVMRWVAWGLVGLVIGGVCVAILVR